MTKILPLFSILNRLKSININLILIALMMIGPYTISAQFAGIYAPENWVFTSQDLSGQTADGSIDLSNMPTGFTIAGNNDELAGANSLYSIVIPEDGTIKFKWSYTTDDGPNFDPAGYRLNGSTVFLTDPEGDTDQNGEESIAVNEGDTFAFLVDATDACCGRGFLTIERFSTADNTSPSLNGIGNIFSGVNPGEIIIDLEGISAGIDEAGQTIIITATSSNTSVIPDPVVTYTSPETNGTLSFTPVTDAFGDATITVNVMDDGGTANGSIDNIDVTFNVSITGNLPPSIDIIDDIESQINQVLSINLEGIDAGPGETQTISIAATSSNQAVIANEDIQINYATPADGAGSLVITPVLNVSGEAIIEVTVTDDGGTANNGKNETSTFFTITIAPNEQPVINELEDLNLFVNVGEQIINLTGINDGDDNVNQTLTITASSSNQALIPDPLVTYTSPDATGTLTLNPATDQFGTTTITVTVTDNAGTNNGGLNETSFTFPVTVLGNFQPEISPLSNIRIGINEPNRFIDLGGITAGVISNDGVITVTASSSNTEVIDPLGIEVNYTSPGTSGSIVLNPVADALGESTITVTVMDDGGTDNGGVNTIQETFVVRVLANRAPTINEINDLGLDINADLQTVFLNNITSGEDSEYQTLAVTATSDNTALIPNPDVTFNGAEPEGAGGSISFTPIADATGTANITVTVTDDGGNLGGGVNSTSMTFEVSVSGNQPPTINEIEDVIRTDTDAFSVDLSGISDGTGLVQNLVITATSDNPTVIPDATVNYTAGSATGSLDFVPTDFGNATITVTVTDDGGTENGGVDTFTQTFNIRLGGNLPPDQISEFSSEINLDGGTFYFNSGLGDQALIFTVFDNDEDDEDNIISVTVTANDPQFEDVVSVNFNPGSFLGGIVFSPPAGLTGIGEFEVTVQDDGGTENNGQDTFVVTMTVIFTEPTTYSASLSDDEAENHIQPFTVDQSGPVLIENIDGNFDASFILYEDRFDPLNPGINQIESGRRITVDLEKDRQYIVVTTNKPIDDLAAASAPLDLILADEITLSFTNAIGVLSGNVGFGFLPNLDFIEGVTVDEDESFIISLSGISDGNGATDNLTLSGTSEGIASFEFTDNLDGTAVALLNPVQDFNGSTSVTITVTGENGSTFDRSFQLTVNPINDAPNVTASDVITPEEEAFTFTVDASDVDTPDNTLTYSLDEASTSLGISIDASTGVLSWTPEEDQDGVYDVAVTVSDGALEGTGTINITVSEVNVAPVLAAIGDQTAAEKSELNFTASATDVDLPANSLVFSLDATSISNGMTMDASSGVFAWTPSSSQAGIYTVEVNVSDGVESDSETLTITVSDVLGLEGESTIEIYPNPSTEYVSINSTEVRSVSILDLNGKELLSLPVTEQIDISELKAGNYIIKLKDKNDTVIGTDRIIKQ